MGKSKKNWAELFSAYTKKHPLIILLTLVVFFISSFFTITEGLGSLRNFYRDKIVWRTVEEKKINSLSPGISIQMFEEVFGPGGYYWKNYIF